MKRKLIIANWKLNGNIKKITDFLTAMKKYLLNYPTKNTIVFAPPSVYLDRVCNNIYDTNIFLAAQNVDVHLEGAFTGEISPLMLKDIGVKYVLIGHSERRIMHHETDKIIAEKFCMIKKLNLTPILCIGEFEQQKYKKTEQFLENQLIHIFDILGETAFRNTVIAYEPIWAIGKGTSADPKNVQFIHCFIRNYISQHDVISAKNLMIQYGGSINQENAKMFFRQKDINGLLVGSASLTYETFIKIIEASNVII